MKLPNGTMVALADGERSLLLVNQGDEDILDLRHFSHEEAANPPTHEMGRDAPGRFTSKGTGPSGPEGPDLHKRAESRFAAAFADTLSQLAKDGTITRLVVICDPDTLGEVRVHYDAAVRKALICEIPRDLTKLPIPEIEKGLSAWTLPG
ncbi:host attachment family protein [Henriciella aquimarina]|uniref:host attachment family protein n=1 Tax=Henriciella aquimarina TaxID=545261 RepID=UPI001301C1FE|nr:host attachment family protein [Henriciella aquimarina]